MDFQIPDKLYFKIGEVSKFTGIKSHVLRYWETEFTTIRPNKSRSNQRLYRKQDVELILYLKDLLYTQGFTIAGARKKLREKSVCPVAETTVVAAVVDTENDQLTLPLADAIDLQLLDEIHQGLLSLKASLKELP